MGGKAMTKGAMTKALATEHGLKQKACSDVINSMVAIATQEVKKSGVFTVPGLCRLKTRVKPATKAGVRVMFGKETKVKAKPAKTIVKVPSGSTEEADLSSGDRAALHAFPEALAPWESHGAR